MSDELILGHEDLLLLHRHYINLTCVDSGPAARASNAGKPARYNFSAFVVDVEGATLAITAGHVFSELKLAVAHGAVLSDWAIDDSMVSDHGFPAYPISVDLEGDIIYFHEDGLDYAAYALDPMALLALDQSGIVPVATRQWDADDFPDFSFWTLIGLPIELATLRHDAPSLKSHVTVHLEGLLERPDGIDDTKYERLYARLRFDSVADRELPFNIGGMSGGPIFGTLGPPQGGSYDYRLIAIQSAWDRKDGVAMCAAKPFLRALSRIAKGISGSGG